MKKILSIIALTASLTGCAIFNPNCSSDELTTNTVYFDFDSSALRADAVDTLNKQAEILKANDEEVLVSGHADERGTREYNMALGARRASAVATYLEVRGVNPERITTISYGKEQPAVDEHNEEAWAKNRRAVIDLSDYD